MIKALAALVVAAAAMSSLAQAAEAYPQQRLVKFIVTTAAGTSPDTIARIVARGLSERLKQQFIVENRPGASGNLAADIVARSEPDGYTIVVGSVANTITMPKYTKFSSTVNGTDFTLARSTSPTTARST